MRELNMQYDEPLQRDQRQEQHHHQQHLEQQEQLQLQPEQLQQQQQEYYEPPQQVQQQPQVPSAEQTLNSDGYAPQMYYDPNAATQKQQQQHLYDPLQQPQQLQPAGYGHIEPASEAYGDQGATAAVPAGGATAGAATTTTGYDYWPSNMQQPYGDEVGATRTSATATISAKTFSMATFG